MRQLFKGDNYSREETIRGNTVCDSYKALQQCSERLSAIQVGYSADFFFFFPLFLILNVTIRVVSLSLITITPPAPANFRYDRLRGVINQLSYLNSQICF